MPAREMIEKIRTSFHEFIGNKVPDDDVTMLVVDIENNSQTWFFSNLQCKNGIIQNPFHSPIILVENTLSFSPCCFE